MTLSFQGFHLEKSDKGSSIVNQSPVIPGVDIASTICIMNTYALIYLVGLASNMAEITPLEAWLEKKTKKQLIATILALKNVIGDLDEE